MPTTVTTDTTLSRPSVAASVSLNTVPDLTAYRNDFTAPPFPVPAKDLTRASEANANPRIYSIPTTESPNRRIVKSESVPVSIENAPITVSHEVTLSNEPRATATGLTKTTFVITTKSTSGILRNSKERSPAKGLPVTFSDQTISNQTTDYKVQTTDYKDRNGNGNGTLSSRSHYDMASYANGAAVQFADDETTTEVQNTFSKPAENQEAEAVIQKVPASDQGPNLTLNQGLGPRLAPTPKRFSSDFPEIVNLDSGSDANDTEPPETSLSFSTEHDDVRIVRSIQETRDVGQGSHRILKTTVTLSPKEGTVDSVVPVQATVRYRRTGVGSGPDHPEGYLGLGPTNLPDTRITSFPISPSRKHDIPIQMATMRRQPKSIIMPEGLPDY